VTQSKPALMLSPRGLHAFALGLAMAAVGTGHARERLWSGRRPAMAELREPARQGTRGLNG